MYTPPPDPRDPTASIPPDLRGLAAAVLLVAAIPLGLFAASRPLVAAGGLVAVLLLVGARRTAGTARRLRDGRRLQVDLPGGVRLRVARHPGRAGEERPDV